MNKHELKYNMCNLMKHIFIEEMGNVIKEKDFYNILTNWNIEHNIFNEYIDYDRIIDNDYSECQYIKYDNIKSVIEIISDLKINSRYGIRYTIDENKKNVEIYYNSMFFANFKNKKEL